MILIPDQLPSEASRPDCFEQAQPRSVELGLQRMDFRHALSAHDPAATRRGQRSAPPPPSRRHDVTAAEWAPL